MEALETTDDINISSFAGRVHELGSLKFLHYRYRKYDVSPFTRQIQETGYLDIYWRSIRNTTP